MAILKKLYPLLSAMLMTGCYNDFTPDIDTRPVLCLNSLITAGEPIEVTVTHTWLYTDLSGKENHSVDDASVSLYANGEAVPFAYIPKEGDRIRIYAASPTYGTAEAEVTVPIAIPIEKVKFTPVITAKSITEDDYRTSVYVYFNFSMNVTINDVQKHENYFHYSCDTFESIYGGVNLSPGEMQYEAEPLFSEHIGVLEAVTGSDAWGFTCFTDRQFSGNRYTLNLIYSNAYAELFTSNEYVDAAANCGFRIRLATISESYYKWANFEWQSDSGLLGDFDYIGLGEPMWGYSNVSTGAGIVVARSVATYDVNLHDLIIETLEKL